MDAFKLVIAAVTTFLGAIVFSTVGFGIGMTSTPVLLLVFDPQTVVVVVNTVSLSLFVLVIFQTRDSLPVREIAPVSVAGLVGVPVGIFVLSSANTSALRVSITILIILLTLAVAFNIHRPIPRQKLVGLLVGFVVGALLAATGIGAALLVLFLLTRGWSRHAMRGALSFYFLLVEGMAVVGYGASGMFTPERVSLILAVIVPVLLGFGLATLLVRRMNEQLFQHAVVVVIIATSLVVLGRELTRL